MVTKNGRGKVDKKSANRGQNDPEPKKIIRKQEGSLVSMRLKYPETNLKKLNKIAEKFRRRYEQFVNAGYLSDLQEEFANIMADENESVKLMVTLDIGVRDVSRSNAIMPLQKFTIIYSQYEPDEFVRDKLFLNTYLVGNRIEIASNKVCPNCWSAWANKGHEKSCPECKMEIGANIKYILTNDHCPSCNHPGFTDTNLQCQNCALDIGGDEIAWVGEY